MEKLSGNLPCTLSQCDHQRRFYIQFNPRRKTGNYDCRDGSVCMIEDRYTDRVDTYCHLLSAKGDAQASNLLYLALKGLFVSYCVRRERLHLFVEKAVNDLRPEKAIIAFAPGDTWIGTLSPILAGCSGTVFPGQYRSRPDSFRTSFPARQSRPPPHEGPLDTAWQG